MFLNPEPFHSISLLTLVKGLALLNYLVRILPDASMAEMTVADAKFSPPQKVIGTFQKENPNGLEIM